MTTYPSVLLVAITSPYLNPSESFTFYVTLHGGLQFAVQTKGPVVSPSLIVNLSLLFNIGWDLQISEKHLTLKWSLSYPKDYGQKWNKQTQLLKEMKSYYGREKYSETRLQKLCNTLCSFTCVNFSDWGDFISIDTCLAQTWPLERMDEINLYILSADLTRRLKED